MMKQQQIFDAKAKPFIKWVGGKQALMEKLRIYFPDEVKNYYEPFVGGGSVFMATGYESVVISDHNEWLIDTYRAIKNNWKKVAEILDSMENSKENFLRIRSIQPKTLNQYQRSAHFIYLNKTCFRGLFRVNKSGEFNVPYGQYDRRYYDEDNLRRVSSLLKKVTIKCGDFESALDGVSSGDFVYFDPPYYKIGGHADFNRYTEFQFLDKDQIRLSEFCRKLDKCGVMWALSNSNTPFIRSLYKGYKIHLLDSRREINLNSDNRNIKELLITNY